MIKEIETKALIQILTNQRHILFELGEMHSSGGISTGIYSKDKISEKLRSETQKIEKVLKGVTAKAMIIFEDKDEDVEITLEGALSDKMTTAQKTALRLYNEIKRTVKEVRNGENS